MKKTRVKKGKRYWWIRLFNGIDICADCDYRREFSTANYNDSNYFHTKREAETMVRKFRALLKGVEMIEASKAVLAFNDFLTYLKENGVLSYEKACEYMKEFQSKIVK